MKIAIYTLTKQRDGYVDNSIAEKLRGHGHEVIVRNYINAASESVCYEKPDVIVHPMPGGQFKLDFIKQCKEWGIEVIVRRGEAGMGKQQFDNIDDNRRSIILGNWDYSPYVDLELTWGQEFTDILAEQGHMPADKLRVCGAYAFDPYFEPVASRPDRKKTILFATGFAAADSREEYCECGIEEGSDFHAELYSLQCETRAKWLDAIRELVKWWRDDYDFELKVRPGEVTSAYLKLDGVKVHSQLSSSSEVLRNVDVLVHSGSTMAIEAHLLGIPSFNFCNINPDPLLAQVSPMLETYKELEFNLARAIPGQSNINEAVFHELQEHLYGPIDGKACERAAGFIHEHISSKEIKTSIPNAWPKVVRYPSEGVHAKKQKGDHWWLCVCCRRVFWTVPSMEIAKCLYCGMSTKAVRSAKAKSNRRLTEGVLK